MSAVRRINIDEDGPDVGGGELGDDPLRPVGGPDADVFAAPDAQRHQGAGEPADVGLELAVGAVVAELREDGGVVVAEASRGTGEHVGEGEAVDPGRYCNVHATLGSVSIPRAVLQVLPLLHRKHMLEHGPFTGSKLLEVVSPLTEGETVIRAGGFIQCIKVLSVILPGTNGADQVVTSLRQGD